MKKLIFSIIILINWLLLFSQTVIPGGEVSGEWTIEGSPYLIEGNISIPDNETLIIESGVIVNFQGLYEFNILGQLLSDNTSDNTICFQATSYWKGIRFNVSCDYNETSELDNFKIERVKYHPLAVPLKIESSNIVLSNFSIANCSGQSNGYYNGNITAIQISSSSPIINNCSIYNVTAQPAEDPGWTTGIYVNGGSPQIISTVCSLIGAEEGRRGITLNLSDAIIINSVIYNSNFGLLSFNSTPTIINTIIWFHPYPTVLHSVYLSNSNPNFYYSNIMGGEEGFAFFQQTSFNGIYENNIDSNPNFVNPDEFNFHLLNDSPCIDAGTPSGWLIPPENNITIDELLGYNCIGNNYDIGAYEYSNNAIEDDLLLLKKVNIYNYPNPFNPTTTIYFSIQNDSEIEISIFNIKGQKVKNLANNNLLKGNHSIIWNGDDENMKPVSSGVYLYKLNVNGKAESTRKYLLLK